MFQRQVLLCRVNALRRSADAYSAAKVLRLVGKSVGSDPAGPGGQDEKAGLCSKAKGSHSSVFGRV